MIILNAWSPGPARYWCPLPAGLSRSRALLVSALSARSWCPRPAGLSRSRSLRVPAPSARYGCPRPAGLSRSKSLLVPAARGALEVEVVTVARGLCSLLVPAARGALEVEIVTGARFPRGSRRRGRYGCPRPAGLSRLRAFLVPAASATGSSSKSRRGLLANRFRGQIRSRKGPERRRYLIRFVFSVQRSGN